MKKILTLFLTSLSIFTFGQTDTTKKKYEYEICIYHRPKEKPTVIKNERIGIGDTTIAFVSGTIYDYEKQPLGFAALNFLSLTDSSKHDVFTDSLGNFKLHLPADKYKLTALFVGYTSLTIDDLQLGTGELRELKLQLGNGGAFKTYLIQSDKPLSEKDLRKTEKRLRRKG
ncbi:carboxypeptidase-like regulatory domain-containing protein [Flavobacterium sp.]|uniref:carboxypeptidase-like regulatory domain-containing protein n=1 Tax=Flavobacterium sp. TaxID=239 RepID=UPI0025CEBF9E|nr:carboxypeptidase-like regulatory domain-containing protein [Flavobacterium sp.]